MPSSFDKVLHKISEPFHSHHHSTSSSSSSNTPSSPQSMTRTSREVGEFSSENQGRGRTTSSTTTTTPLSTTHPTEMSNTGEVERRDQEEGGAGLGRSTSAAVRKAVSENRTLTQATSPNNAVVVTSRQRNSSGAMKKDFGIEKGLNELSLNSHSHSSGARGENFDSKVAHSTDDGAMKRGSMLSKGIEKQAEHEHTTLKPILHHRKHHHQTEYVTQIRDHHIHHHHVQHHLQPLIDESRLAEQHYHQSLPLKERFEQKSNTEQDQEFWALLNKQRHTETEICHDRIVVKNGEQVHETVHYHVHNIIQPVIYRDRPIPVACAMPEKMTTTTTQAPFATAL